MCAPVTLLRGSAAICSTVNGFAATFCWIRAVNAAGTCENDLGDAPVDPFMGSALIPWNPRLARLIRWILDARKDL